MKRLICIAFAVLLIGSNVTFSGQVKSTALEASHVLSGSAGRLNRVDIFNSKGSAQFILIINAATLPADGAVTLLYPPIPIGANSSVTLTFPRALTASTGIVVCNSSTGTSPKPSDQPIACFSRMSIEYAVAK